jgi:MFS family permease
VTEDGTRRSFALGWVVVSYFLVLGGIAAALVITIAAEVRDRYVGYGLVAAGAAIGGLFAGRASPHRSLLEPALAAALVIGSLVAFLSQTLLGQFVDVLIHAVTTETAENRGDMWRHIGVIAGVAAAGGLVGGAIGEITAPATPSPGALRWMGMALLITAGALLASSLVSHVLLVDRALRDGGMARVWEGRQLVSDDALVRATTIALAAGAFLGGLVTQAAAPVRRLGAIAFAVLLGYGGLLFAVIDPRQGVDRDTMLGVVVIAIGGALIAVVGALVGRLISR